MLVDGQDISSPSKGVSLIAEFDLFIYLILFDPIVLEKYTSQHADLVNQVCTFPTSLRL